MINFSMAGIFLFILFIVAIIIVIAVCAKKNKTKKNEPEITNKELNSMRPYYQKYKEELEKESQTEENLKNLSMAAPLADKDIVSKAEASAAGQFINSL